MFEFSPNLAGLEGIADGEVLSGLLEVGERFLVTEDVERLSYGLAWPQLPLAEQRVDGCD